MTKYRYPCEGIYYPNRNNLDTAKTNTTSAVTKSSGLDIPSSFGYYSYLNSLRELLTTKKEELDVINRLFQRDDRDYKAMGEDIQADLSQMSAYTIKERDRMII